LTSTSTSDPPALDEVFGEYVQTHGIFVDPARGARTRGRRAQSLTSSSGDAP
jgi:hypothetical protein